MALYIMGFHLTLSNVLVLFAYDPMFLALFVAVNYRLQKYQVTDDRLIRSLFNASQFVTIPLVGLFFVAAAFSTIFPIMAAGILPGMGLFIFLIFRWKNSWNNRLFKLVEMGFV